MFLFSINDRCRILPKHRISSFPFLIFVHQPMKSILLAEANVTHTSVKVCTIQRQPHYSSIWSRSHQQFLSFSSLYRAGIVIMSNETSTTLSWHSNSAAQGLVLPVFCLSFFFCGAIRVPASSILTKPLYCLIWGRVLKIWQFTYLKKKIVPPYGF